MGSALNKITCVDVIIPVFNGRETIKAALTSVLAQQEGLVRRIIVVDDGSNDDTAQVVSNLDSPFIQLERTPNQGVAKARNYGIEKSKAEWISFLDADDLWEPDKLKLQLAAAKEYNVGFICCDASSRSVMDSGPISVKVLARVNFIATSSVLVKRSTLERIPMLFKPEMSFAEDYLAWLKCLTLTPGYYLSDTLVRYTISDHPRYNFGQILINIFILNLEYSRFLHELGVDYVRRLDIGFAIFRGSLRSILSIMKRFGNSYFKGVWNK